MLGCRHERSKSHDSPGRKPSSLARQPPWRPRVTGRERAVYSVALLTSALSCVLFIAAPAFHRMRFRRHDKAQLLRSGNRCAIAGMAVLAVAMIAAVFLVTEILFGDGPAAVLTAGIAIPMVLLWWIVPAVFGSDRDEHGVRAAPR